MYFTPSSICVHIACCIHMHRTNIFIARERWTLLLKDRRFNMLGKNAQKQKMKKCAQTCIVRFVLIFAIDSMHFEQLNEWKKRTKLKNIYVSRLGMFLNMKWVCLLVSIVFITKTLITLIKVLTYWSKEKTLDNRFCFSSCSQCSLWCLYKNLS